MIQLIQWCDEINKCSVSIFVQWIFDCIEMCAVSMTEATMRFGSNKHLPRIFHWIEWLFMVTSCACIEVKCDVWTQTCVQLNCSGWLSKWILKVRYWHFVSWVIRWKWTFVMWSEMYISVTRLIVYLYKECIAFLHWFMQSTVIRSQCINIRGEW